VTAPLTPPLTTPFADLHRFDTPFGAHVLLADGSRIYDIDPALAEALDAASGEAAALDLLAAHGVSPYGYMGEKALVDAPPVRSLSLAVAQSCNLGCTYCYARQGSFGGAPADMPWDIARASLELLFAEAAASERLQVAFMGGEPLVNRGLIRRATDFAVELAEARDARVAFALTTNGTLLRVEDADFFARHRFAITVSLDGTEAQHDAQRPYKGGRGSYRRIVENLAPLLARGGLDLSARVTVTPRNLDLPEALAHLIGLGFRSVGFSPMLSAPGGADQLDAPGLEVMLGQMIACGREFVAQTIAGESFPFENIQSALREIHRGTHRPYPCGAGAGYFGVSAAGGLFACHRFVDDTAGAMGDVRSGVDRAAQQSWLTERAVDRQEPCASCWARYLCGGGCHHEVIHRGRPACDYIRGWLDFCLGAYVEIRDRAPGYLGEAE
jgi:uncharacterized protein